MPTEKTKPFKIFKERPVEFFLKRLYSEYASIPINVIVIICPFIGALESSNFSLKKICQRMDSKKVPIRIITTTPTDTYQKDAINVLSDFKCTEISYNDSLHAKVYICNCKDESHSFSMFGSCNLTTQSIEQNIEIGIMVFGHGEGQNVNRELNQWFYKLRTLQNTKCVKHINGQLKEQRKIR